MLMRVPDSIAPTAREVETGRLRRGTRFNFFPAIASELQRDGVDGVILAGGWLDVCVMATAFAASDADMDVLLVRDAVYIGPQAREARANSMWASIADNFRVGDAAAGIPAPGWGGCCPRRRSADRRV